MDQFSDRKYYFGVIVILVSVILIIRLFFLQVVDSSYKYSASNNAQRYVTQYPARGLIYDRKGKLLVYNEAAYDLMVTPMQVRAFDTLELCKFLDITERQCKHSLADAFFYSRYKPSVFLKQLSKESYALLQEKLYRYPGFFVQPRTIRKYPFKMAAHLLGYVGEVDTALINKDAYYKQGDYVGISGVEKSYEDLLRGKKGVKIYMVDVHNRIKGSFMEGDYDAKAVLGKDVILTIDAELQAYGELLMANKVGSVVAIDPRNGEILAMISSPGYDPTLLVGRDRRKNYYNMVFDTLKPLFNRALMAKYPPGSTFKLLNALVGLQKNQLTRDTRYNCNYGYGAGPIFVACHDHPHPLDLTHSIMCSCNSYYCNVFRKILTSPNSNDIEEPYTDWRNYVLQFGFGKKLGVDLPNELNGIVASSNYFNKIYGKKHWSSLTIISLAIGQGELGITPIQMANYVSAIANRGFFYTPHVVKDIKGPDAIANSYSDRHTIKIDKSNFDLVVEGMELAVNKTFAEGATASVAKLKDIVVCGKTGTAENPHGEDHSIFICFAPKDNPVIAFAVYVENAGYGASWAAPIASLMMEKHFTDTTARGWLEDYVIRFDHKKKKK